MIQIDENWRFFRDGNNLTLENRRKVAETIDRKKTGRKREEWIEAGFFSGLHYLFLHVLEHDATAARTAHEFDERLLVMTEKIVAAIKGQSGSLI